MHVFELADELQISNEAVLKKLKALKLKAKDGDQVLNKAVIIVLRSELKKDMQDPEKMRRFRLQRKQEQERKNAPPEPPSPPAAPPPPPEVLPEEIKPAEKATVEEKPARKKAPRKTAAKAKTGTVKSKPAEQEKELRVKPEPQQPEKPRKTKTKISEAPFVPLKPLAKKKRKPSSGKLSQDGSLDHKGYFGHKKSGFEHEDGFDVAVQETTRHTTEPSEMAPPIAELVDLELRIPISAKDFSVRIQQKTSVVLKKLLQMGIICNINQNLDEDVVRRLATEFGYNITKMKTQEEQLIETHHKEEEDPKSLHPRAPVITFMGHVDHGKTSLLDRIRKSQIADSEHGGITQHIGAYSVKLPKGRITFLDTPGHEAFTAMRARGAHITDLVVLVVAADEGVMPQTEEAIAHAQAAGVPIVVALNKIDRRNADPDRVKKELADRGFTAEDWGGKTIVVGVSAVTGEGVDKLLEMILLEAEMLELKANKHKDASGIVVEAHMSRGKGTVASLIVQSGTLHLNDIIVVGAFYGKVKAMFDDQEQSIKEAGPSMPVEVLGLPGVPEAGERFYVLQDEKQAREITSLRSEQLKNEKLLASSGRVTLEDLYAKIQEGSIKELNVILKADVQGSVEALKDSLEKIPSSEVKVKFIHAGVGDVNASDVILAVASNAIIIGFQVGIGSKAAEELEKQPVDVRQYRIIYDAVNDVRKALEGM
ncbi:MAG TPA: translation initiation factor IF-2, partial [Candidatus Omnitrophota bacterium]|nr:translation initiation factor IF-2 [Candidatus Omnitrophota bacterium]